MIFTEKKRDMATRQRRFRDLMGRFVTGVSVIAVETDSGVAAMTANAISAVSLDPLLLLCCIRNESRMLTTMLEAGAFSINVLAGDQDDVSRYYGGRCEGDCPAHWLEAEGAPVLGGANASFVCRVAAHHVVGDHTVIYGAVEDMAASEPAAPALLYAAGRYHALPLGA
jgi:flavin reductase (DIM6/NTAB) family NADH-FMN oxidoreductase RutF